MKSNFSEILYLETFKYDATDKKEKVKHIRFNFPVYLDEIRVLPLKFRVNIQGLIIEGLTNPESGKVKVFGVDLNKIGECSTYSSLGSLTYRKNECLHFKIENQIPTDGIVVQFDLSCLTLVIIGSPAVRKPPIDIVDGGAVVPSTGLWISQKELAEKIAAGEATSLKARELGLIDDQSSLDVVGSNETLQTVENPNTLPRTKAIYETLSSDGEEQGDEDILVQEFGRICEDTSARITADVRNELEELLSMESLEKLTFDASHKPIAEISAHGLSMIHTDIDNILACKTMSKQHRGMQMLAHELNSISDDRALAAILKHLNTCSWEALVAVLSLSIMGNPSSSLNDSSMDADNAVFFLNTALPLCAKILGSDQIPDYRRQEALKLDWIGTIVDRLHDTFFSTSVLLLIISHMDRALNTALSMRWFIGTHEAYDRKSTSAYEKSIMWMFSQKSSLKRSRAMVAISKLITKAHLMHELDTLTNSLTILKTSANYFGYNVGGKDGIDVAVVCTVSNLLNELDKIEDTYKEPEIFEKIMFSMKAILHTYQHAYAKTKQPNACRMQEFLTAGGLPVVEVDDDDARQELARFLIESDFIETISTMVRVSQCCLKSRFELMTCLKALVECLLSDHAGHSVIFQDLHRILNFLNTLNQQEDGISATIYRYISGFLCAFHLIETMQRNIRDHYEHCSIDAMITTVYRLVALTTLGHAPKHGVVSAVAANMNCIVNVIRLNVENIDHVKASLNPICHYLADLITVVYRRSLYVNGSRLFMILNRDFAPCILELLAKFESTKIRRALEWLQPLCCLKSFDSDGLESVIAELKRLKESSSDGCPITPAMAMWLIMLESFAIPSYSTEYSSELMHTNALFKIFSADALSILTNFLQVISNKFRASWELGLPSDSLHRELVGSIVRSTVNLMKALICLVCEARGRSYKDVSSLRPCFYIYCILPACMSHDVGIYELEEIRASLIDCFLAYTMFQTGGELCDSGIIMSDERAEDVENYSDEIHTPWKLMLIHAVQLASDSPIYYLSGMCILSEIINGYYRINRKTNSSNPFDSAEEKMARHIWNVLPEVTRFIRLTAVSTTPLLQQATRRLCTQLCDLSDEIAVAVTRDLLLFVQEYTRPENLVKHQSEETVVSVVPIEGSAIVSLISSLLSIPTFKAAFIYLVNPSVEDCLISAVEDLLSHFNTLNESLVQLSFQESMTSLIQGMHDSTVCLCPDWITTGKISNVLPSVSLTDCIVRVLTAHITCLGQPYTSTAWASLCLINIFNQYGVYSHLIERALLDSTTPMCNMIEKFDYKFDKDNLDYLNALAIEVELLRVLYVGTEQTARKRFSLSLMRQIWNWTRDSEDHPLQNFLSLLQSVNSDEQEGDISEATPESILLMDITEEATKLVDDLNSDNPDVAGEEIEQDAPVATWDDIEPLAVQFKQRQPLTEDYIDTEYSLDGVIGQGGAWWIPASGGNLHGNIVDHHEKQGTRSKNTTWLVVDPDAESTSMMRTAGEDRTAGETSSEVYDLKKVDVDNLLTTRCQPMGRYTATQAIEQEYKLALDDLLEEQRTTVDYSAPEIISTSATPGHRNYVAPMRGFGFGRHGNGRSSSRQSLFDSFRSKLPNTSRPPSMHVDEFHKIVEQHQQSIFHLKPYYPASEPVLHANMFWTGGRVAPTSNNYHRNRSIAGTGGVLQHISGHHPYFPFRHQHHSHRGRGGYHF